MDIARKLDNSRQELLDLSLRNTLLNYKLLKSRGVAIDDEHSEEIYRILAVEGKSMTFLPKIEDNRFRKDAYKKQTDTLPERHTDRKLQTKHAQDELQRRLLNSYYTARTYIGEQGVNILYLAVGMLEWYEDKNSDMLRQAPLILIPVTLQRSSVKAPFRLSYTQDYIGENLSLSAKLENDFGLELPSLTINDDFDIHAYYQTVSDSIKSKSRWRVNDKTIALGFFSFGTFLMYDDLDVTKWAEDENLANHPIISALLGDGFFVEQGNGSADALLQLNEDVFIDDYVKPEDNHQVVDADSSQVLAILNVNRGHNLVIQGPPGTGKSQTITNIIAEAIGAGKKVLFVAEKMAALEVVKRRLDTVGLGDACLELHSHKTNKKILLAELQRTLDLGKPRTVDGTHDYQTLLERQTVLNQYSKAVNDPIGESRISPYQAFGQLIQLQKKLKNYTPPSFALANSVSWSFSEFSQRLGIVSDLQNLIQEIGLPKAHLFWGSGYTSLLPQDRRQIEESASRAETAVIRLKESVNPMLECIASPPPKKLADAKNNFRLIQQMAAAPNLMGMDTTSEVWVVRGDEIQEALQAGIRLTDIHAQYDNLLIPEAWSENVLDVRKAYVTYGNKWWRWFSDKFRRAKRELSGLCQTQLPKTVRQQRELAEAILEAQRLQLVLDEHEPLLAQLFGGNWRGLSTNWNVVMEVTDWLFAVYAETAHDKSSIVAAITYVTSTLDRDNLGNAAHTIGEALNEYEQSVENVVIACKINEKIRWGSGGLQELGWIQQESLFQQWRIEAGRAQEMVAYNQICDRLKQAGLTEIIEIANNWPSSGECLVDLVTRAWLEALIAAVSQKRPLLNGFNSTVHEQKIADFCKLDRYQFELNKQKLAQTHWEKLPRHTAGGQLKTLRREFEKKSRHKPIRKLMREAGNAIQAIKPVFMMGPMSIATYLPPNAIRFDLVVFDEASQVRPVNAFGAIARGRQAVVVGDSKQLPPTSFFAKMGNGDDDEEESITADLESILGVFAAQEAPQQMLRWHYRSRHDSLINVSNYEFYDNKLVVFPSPDQDNGYRGLFYHHLPQTHYDRGKSRSNPKEADIVAQAVMRHAQTRPGLTLGVAAFSMSQMRAIQDRVERLRRENPEHEKFFRAHPEEPFFVKNLENVQGDERDVIFISVGYGHDANNHLTMNFGPLNKDGGERRLNVLITRAKQRCEVFTNLKPNDIDLHKTNAQGVKSLKRFLKYAESRQMDIPVLTEKEADSPFEESVAESIRGLGYDVVLQVGSAGFFIDLAVQDPQNPGRYLLGVECDGATYHSSRSARDRDRLRQDVLEGLGWKIHRVWSTDWFQNQTRQIEKLAEALENAKLDDKSTTDPQPNSQPNILNVKSPIQRASLEPTERGTAVRYYKLHNLTVRSRYELAEIPYKQVARYLVQVVETEGPIHQDQAIRRIVDGAGVKRLRTQIKKHLNEAITMSVKQGIIKRKQLFLWNKEMDSVPFVRNRELLPAELQKLKWIAPQEIQLAIDTAVINAYGLREDEICREALALLGLNRVTANRKKILRQVIENMINAGHLVLQNGFLLMNQEGT